MRVVVTRPEPGLSRTMERVAALGLAPVALPLLRYVRLDAGVAAASRSRPSAWIATSAMAIRFAGSAIDLGRPLWAVGRATAEAARVAGFTTVREGPGDGAGLAQAIGADVDGSGGEPMIYLAGHVRSPQLEAGLERAGVAFSTVEVYDSEPIDYPPDLLRALFSGADAAGAVLLYSRETAVRLALLLERHDMPRTGQDLTCLCLSDAVAGGLAGRPCVRTLAAKVPDDAAMMRLLGEIRNQAGSSPV
jgi:uroporphyrinogen-III synthase